MASGTLTKWNIKRKEVMRNLYWKGQNICTLFQKQKLTNKQTQKPKDHSFFAEPKGSDKRILQTIPLTRISDFKLSFHFK